MTIAINSLMCFPPIHWWQAVLKHKSIYLDTNESFRKMTYRNRYRIASANGPLLLSIPIMGGREQRAPLHSILIDNKTNWQKQHWRSLFSAYGRAPFFEHYGPELESLFGQPYEYLTEFNRAALDLVSKAFRIQHLFTQEVEAGLLQDAVDLRVEPPSANSPSYPQVFEDRIGFTGDLSILDLLLNEGPAGYLLLQ